MFVQKDDSSLTRKVVVEEVGQHLFGERILEAIGIWIVNVLMPTHTTTFCYFGLIFYLPIRCLYLGFEDILIV